MAWSTWPSGTGGAAATAAASAPTAAARRSNTPTYNKVHDIWNCLAQDWLQKAAAVGHREEDNYQ